MHAVALIEIVCMTNKQSLHMLEKPEILFTMAFRACKN